PAGFLNRESVSECIRTPEKIYNYEKLIKLVWLKINKNRKIAVKTNHRVVNVRMDKEGKKILSIQKGNSQTEEKFDYVINATYARYNEFCEWLHFAKKNLKFRLKEIQIVSLPAKQSCAILLADGPFATMTPLQKSGNLYTFGDVPLSVHASVTGIKSAAVEDKRWGIYQTRWPQVKERCLFWYPILKKAKYIKSMFAILPTEISSEKTAARPTSVTSHGFGCWSIFSGKIVHSVATAKQILDEVKPTV
ncbi:MAG: hypothetical protein U1C56_00045, partial [Candidatus Curtissbacteria bacterium]|nr:hypothetical protein [Candidatus Curtissbacteria bacterium]